MAIMLAKTFQAFKAAGAPEEDAIAADEELAADENRLGGIENRQAAAEGRLDHVESRLDRARLGLTTLTTDSPWSRPRWLHSLAKSLRWPEKSMY